MTIEWCNKYFRKGNYDIKFVITPMKKLSYLGSDDILIDDYPYKEAEIDERIWIIDRKHNKHIKAKKRIYDTINLFEELVNEKRKVINSGNYLFKGEKNEEVKT